MTTTIMAQATDFSGNPDARRSLVLDLLPDLAPVVTVVDSRPLGSVASGGTVTMTARYADDFALNRILFQASGAATSNINDPAPANTATYTRTFTVNVPSSALPGSTVTLKTSATDNANQSSTVGSVTLTVSDGTKPTATFTAPAANATVDAGSTVNVTVRATDNGKVRKITLVASGAANFSETRIIDPAASATVEFAVPVNANASPLETITLIATAEDEAGNLSTAVNRTLKIRDAVAPSVSLRAVHNTVIQGSSITATVAATDGVQVKTLGLRAEGAVTTALSSNVSGNQSSAEMIFTLNVPYTVTAGSVITLTGTASDAAGNLGQSAPLTVTVTADHAPTAAITAPPRVALWAQVRCR